MYTECAPRKMHVYAYVVTSFSSPVKNIFFFFSHVTFYIIIRFVYTLALICMLVYFPLFGKFYRTLSYSKLYGKDIKGVRKYDKEVQKRKRDREGNCTVSKVKATRIFLRFSSLNFSYLSLFNFSLLSIFLPNLIHTIEVRISAPISHEIIGVNHLICTAFLRKLLLMIPNSYAYFTSHYILVLHTIFLTSRAHFYIRAQCFIQYFPRHSANITIHRGRGSNTF